MRTEQDTATVQVRLPPDVYSVLNAIAFSQSSDVDSIASEYVEQFLRKYADRVSTLLADLDITPGQAPAPARTSVRELLSVATSNTEPDFDRTQNLLDLLPSGIADAYSAGLNVGDTPEFAGLNTKREPLDMSGLSTTTLQTVEATGARSWQEFADLPLRDLMHSIPRILVATELMQVAQ